MSPFMSHVDFPICYMPYILMILLYNWVSLSDDKSRQDPQPSKSLPEQQAIEVDSEGPEPVSIDENLHGASTCDQVDDSSMDVTMSDGELSSQVELVKQLFVKRSENYNIPQLERIYTRIMKGIFEAEGKGTKSLKTWVLKFLFTFVEDVANF